MPSLEEKVNGLIKEGKPVRLHLGCGPKIIEDYINCDIVIDPRIIYYDLTKPLPIRDNVVDDILSVHVIEHISRHLIISIFIEWYRVLKPNGFVAVEWPDLLKACKEVVNNPDCFWSNSDPLVKRTLRSIYGDYTKYPDISMVHKWGYSAESMTRILKTVGYSKVEIQTNLYGKTFVDSRVVGYK
jgi:predicted SAM-dependent methyltransferase